MRYKSSIRMRCHEEQRKFPLCCNNVFAWRDDVHFKLLQLLYSQLTCESET